MFGANNADQEITADFNSLLSQATGTAGDYFVEAINKIDALFGDGYAKRNPGLVGEFMKCASSDFNNAVLAQQIRAGLDRLANVIECLEFVPREDEYA